MTGRRWVRVWPPGRPPVEHRDGIPHDDPRLRRPWRWHRCRPQTRWIFGYGQFYERCACGASRTSVGRWVGRNSRRPDALLRELRGLNR